ncbi:MAG: DUF2291 family protein [Verrucomicrobia bacterium]|nr:DUF2291 family protein [Verrucomicrobiota bacterium]
MAADEVGRVSDPPIVHPTGEKAGRRPAPLFAAAPIVISALLRDPGAAAKQHAHHVGIGGTAYYFVRGAGRVVSTGKNEIVVAVDGTDGVQIALRTGPLFGNTVRDGTGLLNVNEFPGLAEFNALSAAINRLVETRVLPPLREHAVVGAALEFAGCTEVPDAIGAGPVLSLVPVSAEFR